MRLEYSDDGACLFDGAPVMRTEEEEKIVAEAFAMFGCNESIESIE